MDLLKDLEELSGPETQSVRAFVRFIRVAYGQRLEQEGVGLSTESLATDLIGILSDLEKRIAVLERDSRS